MLVLIRLIPRGGPKGLCQVLEKEKRNLFVEGVEPLYAIRLEERREVGIVLDVKEPEAVLSVFLRNINAMASVRRTVTTPLISPLYFPLPKKHPKDMERFFVLIRVRPGRYRDVYERVKKTKYTRDTFITAVSFSFGEEDLVVSLLSRNRETARRFVRGHVASIGGVIGHNVQKMVQSIPLLPKETLQKHRETFMFSAPTGHRGHLKNQDDYDRYLRDQRPMNFIVRLHAKKRLARHWENLTKNAPKYETRDLVPVFASQQEAKPYISVMMEVRGVEGLGELLTGDFPVAVEASSVTAVPLVEPRYFLTPRGWAGGLQRFLISLRVEPDQYQAVRSRVSALDFPPKVHMTYLSYSLGQEDILLSVMCDGEDCARRFATKAFDKMPGVRSYDISTQLRSQRLTSKARWRQHRDRYLSRYDRQHREEFDRDFDWMDDMMKMEMMEGQTGRDQED